MAKERKIKRGVTVTNAAYKAFDGEKLVDRVVTFTGSIGDKACASRIKKTDSDAIISTVKTEKAVMNYEMSLETFISNATKI